MLTLVSVVGEQILNPTFKKPGVAGKTFSGMEMREAFECRVTVLETYATGEDACVNSKESWTSEYLWGKKSCTEV